MARGNNLDQNTLLTLNQKPGSIDLHNMALAKMKNTKIDPAAKHEFISDRARKKDIKNIDELYEKLNSLERNGVLDIWIRKFGKKKYLKEHIESIDISAKITEETDRLILTFSQKFIEEIAGAIGGATGMSGSTAQATMGGNPLDNKKLHQKQVTPTEYYKTHRDTKLSKKQ